MGAAAGEGGTDHPMGCAGGKAEMRGSILLREPCLKPPKTTGVCVVGEGLRKQLHNSRS